MYEALVARDLDRANAGHISRCVGAGCGSTEGIVYMRRHVMQPQRTHPRQVCWSMHDYQTGHCAASIGSYSHLLPNAQQWQVLPHTLPSDRIHNSRKYCLLQSPGSIGAQCTTGVSIASRNHMQTNAQQ